MGSFQNHNAWLQAFPSLSPPPPSYFCSRPIFRAGKTLKSPFFALCSTEMLAAQATVVLIGDIVNLGTLLTGDMLIKMVNCERGDIKCASDSVFFYPKRLSQIYAEGCPLNPPPPPPCADIIMILHHKVTPSLPKCDGNHLIYTPSPPPPPLCADIIMILHHKVTPSYQNSMATL